MLDQYIAWIPTADSGKIPLVHDDEVPVGQQLEPAKGPPVDWLIDLLYGLVALAVLGALFCWYPIVNDKYTKGSCGFWCMWCIYIFACFAFIVATWLCFAYVFVNVISVN